MHSAVVFCIAFAAGALATPVVLRRVDTPPAEEIKMPECAVPCIEAAVKEATDCPSAQDVACVCANMGKVIDAGKGCVLTNCGLADALGKPPLIAAQKRCRAERAHCADMYSRQGQARRRGSL